MTNKAIRPLADEFRNTDLGDKRRTKRLVRLAEAVSKAPSASFPTLARSDAELEATYRLLSNPSVQWKDVLAPHIDATAQRAAKYNEMLVVHDTTEMHFPGSAPRRGLGHMSNQSQGFYAHTALAVTADGSRLPLGVLGLLPIFRKKPPRKLTASEATKSSAAKAQWEKESDRWRVLAEMSEVKLGGKTSAIHVMDREADDFYLMAALVEKGRRFVIRADANRILGHEGTPRMFEQVAQMEGVLLREVSLCARQHRYKSKRRKGFPNRRARLATLYVRARCLQIPRPLRNQSPNSSLQLNVVHVYEPEPPAGEEPVEWFLLTSEPISTLADMTRVVDYYCGRWTIEDFFKALKTGCGYEQRQLESAHALLNTLALMLPAAWYLLLLRSVTRQNPDREAIPLLMCESQVVLLRKISKRVLLGENPTTREILLAIAGLGGHIKYNGEPGWQVLGRGYQQLLAAELGWRLARGEM
jgi:hypothetical protein